MTQLNNKVLGANVLVEVVDHENKTKGGIFLVDNDQREIRSELVKIIDIADNAFIDCFGEKSPPPPDLAYALIQRNTGHPFKYCDDTGKGTWRRIVCSDHILYVMCTEDAIKYCDDNFNFKLNINENDQSTT